LDWGVQKETEMLKGWKEEFKTGYTKLRNHVAMNRNKRRTVKRFDLAQSDAEVQ
jgi:hypothetical protein